jgi:hypothetical protein
MIEINNNFPPEVSSAVAELCSSGFNLLANEKDHLYLYREFSYLVNHNLVSSEVRIQRKKRSDYPSGKYNNIKAMPQPLFNAVEKLFDTEDQHEWKFDASFSQSDRFSKLAAAVFTSKLSGDYLQIKFSESITFME